MLRIIPLLLAATLLAHPAEASVTYAWQQVEASSKMPANLNLELVFSDKAVSQGELILDIGNDCRWGSCEFSQDSLLSLRYWYGAPDAPGGTNFIDYGYRTAVNGAFHGIELRLSFLPNGVLGGSVMANNGESDFFMESVGSLFTMVRANSDQEGGCGFAYPDCSGSTGLLREVPEPSSAALAGLGLLAVWLGRRRKSRKLA